MERMLEDGVMRVGEELIQVDQFSRTDDDVWVLKGCTRGYQGSSPKSHVVGTEMAGVDLYLNKAVYPGDNFGTTNSLAEEICGEYGDFLNDVNAGHLHFDGSGQINLNPWCRRDYTDYIYSRMENPTTGSIVGGTIKANFERQFSTVLTNIMAVDYWDIRIGLRLHQEGRIHLETSSSMLDLHFDALDGVLNNSRRPTFAGGASGAALTMEILENYGKTDEAFQLFKYWIELAPAFDDADVDYIKGYMSRHLNHWKGEDILVLSTNETDGFIFTPHRIMGRTSGEDDFITIDQEWGAVPRFQDIAAGTTIELYNPNAAQTPQVVIRVEESSV
ncbi:hypothetical protein P4E94_19520, partial [Pontiellaceae bacterium B12219]|nr:hypothetical protein [Pontiellaceae bacterium B12219]